MKVSVLVLALVVPLGLAGCSTDAAPDAERPLTTPTTSAVAVPGPPAVTFGPLECDAPSDILVRRTLDVVAAGAGSLTASTLVPAVTTGTGNWYIIGLDRDTTVGDGTMYPDKAVRALAVTDADARHATVIRLGNANGAISNVSWRKVDWTGETLAQGKRALAKAVSCLDAGS